LFQFSLIEQDKKMLDNIILIFVIISALAETALLFFFSVGISRWQKNKCAVCVVAFSAQMLNFSTIPALCTTVLYMFCGGTAADSASWPPKAGPQLRSSVRIS